MQDQQPNDLDMRHLLATLGTVMDRLTMDSKIGRILMPGASYLGVWARDTGVATLGLNRLGKSDLAGDLLCRYWSIQITPESNPDKFIFRNKRFAAWTDADAFRPTGKQLLAEVGAFPTSVYLDTPDFPAGTREIYSNRADLDSTAWLIIALHDYYCHAGDDALLRELAPNVERAIAYLRSRDVDGDHLLEQGPNEDWADTLLRHGKVAYTQDLWFRALEAASRIFAALGDEAKAAEYHLEREAVRWAVNRTLLTHHGYYANFVALDGTSLRRSLDTALLGRLRHQWHVPWSPCAGPAEPPRRAFWSVSRGAGLCTIGDRSRDLPRPGLGEGWQPRSRSRHHVLAVPGQARHHSYRM